MPRQKTSKPTKPVISKELLEAEAFFREHWKAWGELHLRTHGPVDLVAAYIQARARVAVLEACAGRLVANLPPGEIDLCYEVWGNTNTKIVMDARKALAEALGMRHVWPENDEAEVKERRVPL